MKKFIFLIIFVNIYINTFAQDPVNNMIKYWNYRNRLKYFVIPGTKQGESEVIGIRNDMSLWPPSIPSDTLYKISTIGDHGVIFGFYLGMLATEYKLLTDNGQDASNTLYEIDLALEQFANYMDRCEYYWDSTNVVDGFFVDENVPCNFMDTNSSNGFTVNSERHLDLLNKNLTLTNNHWESSSKSFGIGVPRGHPGYNDSIRANTCGSNIPQIMSQDNAIGILKGLALIAKFCPSNLSSASRHHACAIIEYIQNKNSLHGPLPWQVYQPDGTPYQDQSPLAHSYGFVKASEYFNNYCVSNDLFSIMRGVWDFQALVPANKIYNNSMRATLAAIGKSWHINVLGFIGVCPLCLFPIISIPATGWGINRVTSSYNNETFYLLLYEVLRNKHTHYLSQNKVEAQLNSAPCDGPYDYGHGIHAGGDVYGGWASSNRFHNEIWRQQGDTVHYENNDTIGKFNGNYNSLDYMLFYNLSHIIYGGIPYVNYNNRYLTDTVNLPVKYIAFDSIVSIQVINPTQPIVEYKAGKQIELKPGFHAQAGSTFHAYIDNVCCGENFITDSIPDSSNYVLTSEDTCVTDTMPCGYGDTLYFNGIEGDTANQFTYYWDFSIYGNPQTSNIKNPSVYFPAGTFNITLEITDTTTGVSSGRLCIIIVKPACDTSGSKMLIKKPELNSSNYHVNVFPNPTTCIFNVLCSDISLSYSIEVSDVIGNIVYNVKNSNGLVQFDLSSKPKGIYFVKVKTSDKKIYYRKIIHN